MLLLIHQVSHLLSVAPLHLLSVQPPPLLPGPASPLPALQPQFSEHQVRDTHQQRHQDLQLGVELWGGGGGGGGGGGDED